jgi:hypothetical protein
MRLPGAEVDHAPLMDPLAYGRTALLPLPAPILGHSDYQADPVFAEERRKLLARLRPAGPEGPDVPEGPEAREEPEAPDVPTPRHEPEPPAA